MVVPDLAGDEDEAEDTDEQAEVDLDGDADMDAGPSDETEAKAELDATGEDIELVELDDDDVTGDLFSGDEPPESAGQESDDPLDDPFFSGEETASGTGNQGDTESGEPVDPLDDAGSSQGPPDHVQEAIVNGAARMSVIGLDDHEKDDLQDEFRDTFEMFQLGYFGGQVVEEHFSGDPTEMDPVWGFIGATLICAAVVVWKRPDGDEMVESAKSRLSALANGGIGGDGGGFSKPDFEMPNLNLGTDDDDESTDEEAEAEVES